MPHSAILRNLKNLNLRRAEVTLALVKNTSRERVSQYTVKYVPIVHGLKPVCETSLQTKLITPTQLKNTALIAQNPRQTL